MRELNLSAFQLGELVHSPDRLGVVIRLRNAGLAYEKVNCTKCHCTVFLPLCSIAPNQSEPRKKCKCGQHYTWRFGSIFNECPGTDFQILLFVLQQYVDQVSEIHAARALENAIEGDRLGRLHGPGMVHVRTISNFYDRLTWRWIAAYNRKYEGVWGRLGGVCTDLNAPSAAGAYLVPGSAATGGQPRALLSVAADSDTLCVCVHVMVGCACVCVRVVCCRNTNT